MPYASSEARRECQRRYKARNRDKILAAGKEYREKNKEQISARLKKFYQANRERYRATNKRWVAANQARSRDIQRNSHLKANYGITLAEQQEMLAVQQGRCRICDVDISTNPCVDHCHATKAVRGLLCKSCNFAVGHLKDSPTLARRTAAYLEAAQRSHELALTNAGGNDDEEDNSEEDNSEED